MRVPARVHAGLRGPVRSRLRAVQERNSRWSRRTTSGPPDFVGIGAQRCGTSWWHSLIEQHPKVDGLGLGAKELHFFDEGWRGVEPTLAADYARHFRRRPGQVIGEWTPRYMLDPWVTSQLALAAPDVKLLVLLRDPESRFVSGMNHALKSHPRLTADLVTAAFTRGLYADQLTRVLDVVPRERLLVLQLEQCLARTQHHLDRTFSFLGLESIPVPSRGSRNTAVGSTTVDPTLVESVRHGYRTDAVRLAKLFPDDIDLDLWGSAR